MPICAKKEQVYHLTAASDEQSHHFAEEACLQRVEIVVSLEECVDGSEQWLGRHKHLRYLVHIGRDQITGNVRIPAATVVNEQSNTAVT